MSSDYLKVKDEPGLVRDAYSSAILSSDLREKERFKQNQRKEANINKINDIEEDVKNMKSDIEEIKNLLKVMINNSNDYRMKQE